jgi:hypothetical protein
MDASRGWIVASQREWRVGVHVEMSGVESRGHAYRRPGAHHDRCCVALYAHKRSERPRRQANHVAGHVFWGRARGSGRPPYRGARTRSIKRVVTGVRNA